MLVDTEPSYFRATQEVLASVGVPLSRQEFLEINIVGGRSAIALAARAGYSETGIRELREERDALYSEMLGQGVRLMPDIEETLAALAADFRMAIVTSCPARHFEIIHQNSGLLKFFEQVIKREDYPNSKPSPDPYLTALRAMGVKAQESIAIEDSPRGLASAVAAGIDCIVHQSEFTEGLEFPGALSIASSVREIPEIIALTNAARH